jgi:hypothetical protein
MSKARKTLSDLTRGINNDLRVFAQEFLQNLKTTTPIRSGFARSKWVSTYSGKGIGSGGKIPIAKNDASYIGVLDGRSPRGFWSSQAPQGVVEPALKKTKLKSRKR